MLSHDRIWAAIDTLADRHGLSPSGLARKAGLDPTTFNRSKRVAADGRPRWPSTESIAKILAVTGDGLGDFFAASDGDDSLPAQRAVPLLGLAQSGVGGFFEGAGGSPIGAGPDTVPFPVPHTDAVFALEVAGDSMLPAYRNGDVLIVSRAAAVRNHDRVVVRTIDGEVLIKVLSRRTPRQLELASLNPDHPPRRLAAGAVDWMARILWASQ